MPNLKNKKVIKDQQGQRKYPGRVTKIQGNTMATTGYGDIPLYVVPNVGNPMVVPANSGNRVFPGASSFTEYPIAKNSGWLDKYQVGGKKGKKQGNPVSDWFYNTEDVQGTYKMAPDLDPFLKNWLKNPETQKRLKNNLASSFLTKDEDPKKLTDQAISRLDNLPMFSRELVQKSGISSSDIKNNNELQGWKTPSSIGNNPYYKGNKDQLGVYMPDYHVSMVNNFNSPGVITHEQTHGTGPFQKNMEKVIFEKYFDKKNNPDKKFIGDWSSARDEHLHRINEPIEKLKQRYPAIYDDYKKNQEYLDKDGMYPRIMDIRRSLNLKPGQKVDKSIFENNSILGPVDDLKTYYDDDTIIDMLNTLAKSNNVKNLPTAEYGGLLDTYQDGGKTLEEKINKALGDPRKKASDAAINKKWFNKETKKWEVEDDIDNFRHPMAARYTAEAIANKFPDWMKYSGIPQVAGFVGSTALGVGHELANNKYTSNNPKDYPNYTFWDTVSEAGEDAFNNMVGAGVGVLPISDDKKTSFLRYLSDNNKIPDGYANKKANMYFKRNGGLIDTYGDNPKAQVGKALKEYENDTDPISHLKWGKYIDDPKRREQHIIDVYQYLMDSNWEPSSIVDFMKKNGSYGSKNRGNIAKKGADWGWDSEDINNEVLGKAWDDYYNNRTVYDKKEYGGWLENYGDGGETDPPVNLRSASTQLASPVSTQAPEVPLNKTGWDWVKQKYENRQPSDWNMLMMDKSGSYVDSGVDPFSLMLTAPQQVVKLANLPFKQAAKNSVESIKNNVGKIKQNFKNASSSTKNVLAESFGELVLGKSNKKSIKKGNEWLNNWIKDPATQAKIDNDLNLAFESDKLYRAKLKNEDLDIGPSYDGDYYGLEEELLKNTELMKDQSKNFKPNSQEYSLSKQFDENLKQYLGKPSRENIHKNNLGVSYQHDYSPKWRDLIERGEFAKPERYGSWISRNPLFSKTQRTSTTIHEGTHDWVSADVFEKSGMRDMVLSTINPKIKEDFMEWENLRNSGINPAEKMGSNRAYQAYLADPTEMHARISELRNEFKIIPSQEVTSDLAKKIITKINEGKSQVTPGFLKVIDNDPEKLSKLFNQLWTAAPIVGAGYLGGKALQQNKQDNSQWLNKYQNGGYVVNSGDNLSTIAKNNNTDIATLQSLNNIKDVNRISIGQNLILPKKQVGINNANVNTAQIKDLNSYSFNEAFKIARKQLGPNKIFEHNGKKFGTNLAGEKFVPDQEELAKNNMLNDAVVNHLNDQNKKVESIYTTKNTVKLQPTWKENTEIDAQNQEFNKLKNAELINKYQSLASPNEKYIIVDKKKGKMHVYLGGKEIESYNVGTGENKGDEQTRTWVDKKTHKTDWSKGNKQTGAGIYTISFIDEHNKHYGNAPSFHLKNESGTEVPTAIHAGFGDRLRRIANNDVKNNDPKSGEDTRFSNGCVNGLCKDMTDLYKNDLKQDRDKNTGTKVFILPDDDSNYFSVKNNKLNFTTSGKYNQNTAYSPKSLNASPIKIKVLNKDFETKEVKNMAKTLEDNKSQIMKDANIDNDTYNKLSKMAISLSLQETKGGTDYNIRIKGYGIPGTNKEEQQGLVSGLKNAEALLNKYKKDPMSSIKDFAKLYLYANGQSSTPPKITEKTSVNSKGMTQIKYDAQNKELVSQFKKYGITKDNLNQGKNAAIATVLMLSYMHNNELPSLKEKIKKMNISDEEALLYLNQGKKSEIVNGTATPKKNMYIKNIKKYSDQISLKQQSY